MTDTTELAALLERATRGPWAATEDNLINDTSGVMWSVASATAFCGPGHDRSKPNAALIAMAPTLAADVMRLTAIVGVARAIITHPGPGSIEAQ